MKRESTLRSRLRNQESCSVHLSACRSRSCCCGSWRFGTPPLINLSLCYPALPSLTHLQDHVGKQLCPSLSLAEREVMAWHLKPQAAGYVVVIICNYGMFFGMSQYVLASWHHNQSILAGPGPLHLDVRHWLWKSLEDVVLHSITGTFRAMPLKCAALPMTGGCAVPITTAKA